MRKITLNQGEKLIANLIGHSRQGINVHKGVYDNRVHKEEDPEWSKALATAAELAFCRMVNCYPDLSVLKPGQHDCVYAGYTWDVKYILNPTHNLLVTLGKEAEEKRSDYYVLFLAEWENFIQPAVFHYLGYATASMVFDGPIRYSLPKPAYCVYQAQLKKEPLLDILNLHRGTI